MLKPGGAEAEGARQMLQVSHHVSSPRQTADGGVQRGGGWGRGGKGGGGKVEFEKVKGVNTGGDETAQTSAGQHLFLQFILFNFLAFFLISNTKTHVLKKQPWCVECGNKENKSMFCFCFVFFFL